VPRLIALLLIALLLGGFGFGAYLRQRGRRRAEPDYSPADELRSKLAESRASDEPATEPQAPEPPADLASDLEERRREVHERARGSIDDLS
jgi:hypothetical protein